MVIANWCRSYNFNFGVVHPISGADNFGVMFYNYVTFLLLKNVFIFTGYKLVFTLAMEGGATGVTTVELSFLTLMAPTTTAPSIATKVRQLTLTL